MEELLQIKYFWKKTQGQTLVEILVALGTSIIIVSAIVISVSNALSNAQFSKNQNLASHYTQQGMEIMRKKRDSDINTFKTYGDNTGIYYCLGKDSVNLVLKGASCTSPNTIDNFIREVFIQKNSSSCPIPNSSPAAYLTKIIVSVFWSDSKCTDTSNLYCHKTESISCFSDFNLAPPL